MEAARGDARPEAEMTGEEAEAALSRGSLMPPSGAAADANGPTSSHAAPLPIFQGRESERQTLVQALSRTHDGELSLVIIEGESGIGKSALVREFVREERIKAPHISVLNGQCYEHERIPYKAFDGCIQALARELGALPAEVCADLLPPRVGLLTEVFPVLSTVAAIQAVAVRGRSVDPTARRLDAFRALAALLTKLAEKRPVILVVDDLQWADQESFRLLRALCREARPPVLVVCTLRSGTELPRELADELEDLRRWDGLTWIKLRGLPVKATQALARQWLGREATPRVMAEIAKESGGHPLLVAELSRYAASGGAHARSLTLETALLARITHLSSEARRLLAAIALSSRPQQKALFARVWGSANDFQAALDELIAERLVRAGGQSTLAPFHDQVRAIAAAQLDAEQRRDLHRRLAEALAADHEAEPAELALHWDGAGDRAHALAAYLRAAAQASDALAFAQAAQLYERALELHGHASEGERRELLTRYAHALAHNGQSAAAASRFGEAAQLALGEEHIRMRVWAAQHQVQSLALDEGLASATSVLAGLNVTFPRGTAGSLARILLERGRLLLRGFRVGKPGRERAAETLALDAMAALVFPLSWAAFLPGSALNMCYLRRALASGQPGHAARALCHEAVIQGATGQMARAASLLTRSEEQARLAQDPALDGYVAMMRGSVAGFQGQYAAGVRDFERAEALLSEARPSDVWLVTNLRVTWAVALYALGEHRRLAADSLRWRLEAESRGDAFALSALLGMGHGFAEFLMRDAPGELEEALARSMRPWQGRPFGLAQHGEIITRGAVAAYTGELEHQQWFESHRAEHDRAYMQRRGAFRDNVLLNRCLAGLGASASALADEREGVLAAVDHDAKQLEHASAAWGAPLGDLFRAQVAALSGQREQAHALAVRAHHALTTYDMVGIGHSASYLIGLIEGGDGGRSRCTAAVDFFREQGWQDPWRAVTLFAPAARNLESDLDRSTLREPLLQGRYRTVCRDGVGGETGLTDARDTRSGRIVTLRSLAGAKPDALARFKQEFRALADVYHENLARLEALFEHEGVWTIVMERVPPLDFLGYVRPSGVLEEARLRKALWGLLCGAKALHDAGFVHRDIRPHNVRVTDDGRVLLVGAGMLTPLDVRHREQADRVLGDVAFVAPEQVDRPDFDASADVYAIGICLYVALTGQLPFDQATPAKVLDAKRRGRAVPPWAMAIEVPVDLEELCLAMVDRAVEVRPTVSEALTRLLDAQNASQPGEIRRARDSSPPPKTVRSSSVQACRRFAGRTRELELLERGLWSRSARCTLTLVEGESGVGKTTLVTEALDALARRDPSALIVRSRCYANEQVPFKAFDGAVDQLARTLRKRPQEEVAALLPEKAALLAQLFPVLGSVPAIGGATKKGLPAEAAIRRRSALDAFAHLLGAIGREGRLVVAVDDLQWADVESLSLLRQLQESAEPVRCMVIATLRPHEVRDLAVEQELLAAREAEGTLTLALGGLDVADARALARAELGEAATEAEVEAVVHECGGHPLFLKELALYASAEAPGQGGFELGKALAARLDRVSTDARTLLELVALSGHPCQAHVLERALRSPHNFEPARRELLAQELVRTQGQEGLVCFHDRVREVALSLLPAERRKRLCAQLAEAFEAEPDADAAERGRLWDAAAEPARAIPAYKLSGRQALETLAFEIADRLFARALELKGEAPDAERTELLTQRAHALVGLAQSAQAASLYAQAAEQASGEERIRLCTWAAQHQIQSAQLEAGMESARGVLSELNVPFARSTGRAVGRFMWERARIALRSYDVRTRQAASSKRVAFAHEKVALDAMEALMFPISWVELMPGNALNMHHLRRAIDLGEPGHVARALSHEAAFLAMLGRFARCKELLERATMHAASAGDPAVGAYVQLMKGSVATFAGNFAEALTAYEGAEELLATSCPREAWLLTNVRMSLGFGFFHVGAHERLRDAMKRWLAEAETRRDAFASAALLGMGAGALEWLMRDEPAALGEELARSVEPWQGRPLGFVHHGELVARSLGALYTGSSELLRWFRACRTSHDRALMYGSGMMRDVLMTYRAYAALHACAAAAEGERLPLLREAERDLRKISEQRSVWGAPSKQLLSAQVALLGGERAAALTLAKSAQRTYEELGARAFVCTTGYLCGFIEEPGAQGQGGDAVAFFADQGWQDPWRALTMFAPAVRALHAP